MKKQKSKTAFPALFFIMIALVFGVIAGILRTVQLLHFIDFNTGFYQGPQSWMIALNVVLVIALIVCLVVTMVDRNKYYYSISKGKNLLIGLAALVMGMAFICYGVTDILNQITGLESHSFLAILQLILKIASGFSMFYLALTPARPNRTTDLIHLVPCIWAAVTLVAMFLKHTMVITVSENLYNLLRMMAILMFFLCSAKYYCGCNDNRTGRWMIFSGMLTFILSSITTIPLLIAHFTGHGYLIGHVIESSFLDLVLMIYIAIVTIIFIVSRRNIAEIEQQPVEQNTTEEQLPNAE